MTDFDREERAFRSALDTHSGDVPDDRVQFTPRSRTRWVLPLAAAVTVAALALPLAAFVRDHASPGPATPETSGPVDNSWRWIAFRDVEAQAPAAWDYDYEPVRPDCIRIGVDASEGDIWRADVPDRPYVTVGVPNRMVPAIGCVRRPQPGDPDPAFGALPFALWQPYVKLDEARPDLADSDRQNGRWQYEGWQLTRTTLGRVQITVLASPDDPDLAETVMASARQVETTTLGCPTTSPVDAQQFTKPTGAPVPAAVDVAAVAICEYSRRPGHDGLEGSRRINGDAARQLVEAIHDAPAGSGPDRPQNCVHDMYGDQAIALRFFGLDETTQPLAEAYVYYDWCFGNGIVDSDGSRQLTFANCHPLFARPPITLWSSSAGIAETCGPLGG